MPPTSPTAPEVRFRGNIHGSLLPYRTVVDAAEVRIVSAPFPWLAAVAMNAILLLFFAGFFYLTIRFSSPSDRLLGIAAGVPICLLILCALDGVFAYTYWHAARLGPLLIYRCTDCSIVLPREGRTFPLAEIRLQWLYTVPVQRYEADFGSELQLVFTPSGAARETFVLIASALSIGTMQQHCGPFERLLLPIQEHTPIQVVAICMSNPFTILREMPYPPAAA